MKLDSIPKLLSRKKAAETLGVSTWTIDELVRRGELKGIKICERVRYPLPALLALLNRDEEGTNDAQ